MGVRITGSDDAVCIDFESFYNQLHPLAVAYAMKKVSCDQDAEDLVCDAFLYCHANFSAYNPSKASYKTWFFIVLKSRINNYYRDKKPTVPLEELGEFPSDDDYLIEAVRLQEQRQMIAEALRVLPEMQRQIVIFRFFQDCDTAETAKRVGITQGNVRTQLSRALAKMRKYCEMKGLGGK